jgi:hypothetical protein
MFQSRNPVIVLSMTVLSVVCLFSVPTHAKYSGGTGEPNDPYQIRTAADLIAFGNEPNDYGRCFALTADIDMDPNLPGNRVSDRAVIAPDTDGAASSFQGTPFTGTLDGQGHAIRGLVIDSRINYAGLFGMIGSGGRVCNLRLVGSSVRGRASTNAESGTGGLVGGNQGVVVGCCFVGSVGGTDFACGGLVGDNSGMIAACYSEGSASSEAQTDVGGLVGFNSGSISACYSTASASSTGGWRVAGLAAGNEGIIVACYSTGFVGGKSNYFGGLAAQNYDTISACFWDIQTSGQTASAGGVGLAMSQMRTKRNFADAGWDFLGERTDGLCEYWMMPAEGGCPVLSIFNGHAPRILQGAGTSQSPYLLRTADDWSAIWYDPTGYYRLEADVDLLGILWHTPAIPVFWGCLEGQGHRIVGTTIKGTGYVGLVGLLSQGAVVRDLGIEDVNCEGSDGYVGSLAGYNRGTVSNCHSTGQARGGSVAGGLVGGNAGMVSACCSAVLVSGGDSGGLVGHNETGAILACHSEGAVSGSHYAGGLAASNSFGSISACYSTGKVEGSPPHVGGLVPTDSDGSISACFWDIQTSGQTVSGGGEGKLTAEMQAAGTFLDAGLDFLGERANGLCEYWQMPGEGGYPVLSVFNGYVPHAIQGTGDPNDPYLLKTAEDMSMVWCRPTACYQLASDIDLAGVTWRVAVVPMFSGALDGQGHRITGMTLTGGRYLGLIGILSRGAVVRNPGIEDVNIAGVLDSVGALVGYNYGGTISMCHSTGSVCGRDMIGGLAGRNDTYGKIVACNSTGFVSGNDQIGGLVGLNDGTISACRSGASVTGLDEVGGLVGWSVSWILSTSYSTGPVSGYRGVGGLVGRHSGLDIRACYSTGSVEGKIGVGGLVGLSQIHDANTNRILACFWDIQTSGQTASAGGTGRTTAQMQTAKTLLDAGWDFVDEKKNGTADVWWIDEGKDYPKLWWEACE